MKWEDVFFWSSIVALILMSIAFSSVDYSFKKECENAGGTAIITSNKNHCLNPSAFIELKEKN